MTPEEIIAMAKEAGFPFNKYGLLQGDDDGEIDADAAFASFAALVADKAAARERDAWRKALEPAFAGRMGSEQVREIIQSAIRARGQKEGA